MKLQWDRWSPLAGVLAVAGMIIAFAIVSGSPGTNDSDAKITSYFTSDSHQSRGVIGFFVFLAGILFLLSFFSTLRARLVAAEGATARLGAFVWGTGVASAILWVASLVFFTGPAFTADDTSKFQVDPNTYRIVNDMGYEFWVAAVIVGALAVWGTSVVALRTGVLPRWFAWLGILVGIVQLLAIFFIPVFIYWGWIIIVAVLLTWRPAPARPA